LVKVFAGVAPKATVAAYSVGQQIAIGALTFGIGFASIVFIFRYRSFREVIARGQAERATSRSPREPRAPG
jgi:glycosyltransferase 2 family protein